MYYFTLSTAGQAGLANGNYSPRLRYAGRPSLQQAVRGLEKKKNKRSFLYEVEKGDERSDVGMSNLATISTPVFVFHTINTPVHYYIYTDERCRRNSTMVLS